MDFDFRQARASDFDGIQRIFTYYVSNTVMALVRDVPSTLGRLQQSMDFPGDDDDTPVYPLYLPVPVLVARRITHDGNKPKIVGYTFLGPTRRHTAGHPASMELYLFVHPDYVRQGIGGALLSMLLTLVHSERGVRCYDWVIAEQYNLLFYSVKEYKASRIVAAVSIDPASEDGGEWLPGWLETKGFVEYNRLKGATMKFNKAIDTAYLEYIVDETNSDGYIESDTDDADDEAEDAESDDIDENEEEEGHTDGV